MPHPIDDDDARDVMTSHRHPNSSSMTPTNVPTHPHNSANHAEQGRLPAGMGELRIAQLGGRVNSSPSAEDSLQLALKAKTFARAQQASTRDDSSPTETKSQKQLNEYRRNWLATSNVAS
jgi:hypothetical protein